MKKGFTLIEIIISISIVLILGVSATTIIVNNKNDKELEKITKQILDASALYLETEIDENGNSYKEGLLSGGTGVVIPLNKLVETSYIKEETLTTLEHNGVNKNNYILAGVFEDSKDDCEKGDRIIKFEPGWTDKLKDETETTYLCDYSTGSNFYEEEKKSLSCHIFDEYGGQSAIKNIDDVEQEGTLIAHFNDVNSMAFSSSGVNGFFTTCNTYNEKCIYFYTGVVGNNYVSINNILFRILWINGHEMRLITEKSIDSKYFMNNNDKVALGKLVGGTPANFIGSNNYDSDSDISKVTDVEKAIIDWKRENFDDVLFAEENGYQFHYSSLFSAELFCSTTGCIDAFPSEYGLLSSEEASFAGAFSCGDSYSEIFSGYTYNGNYNWTKCASDNWLSSGDSTVMFPVWYNSGYSSYPGLYGMTNHSNLHGAITSFPYGPSDANLAKAIRPVVVINGWNTEWSGNGTISNPYVLTPITKDPNDYYVC